MKRSQLSYSNSRGPINNVEVKNIKSAGFASLIQLQRKLLQHLDLAGYVARHLHFVANDKKGPALPRRLFSWVINKCFAWSWLRIKICGNFILQ